MGSVVGPSVFSIESAVRAVLAEIGPAPRLDWRSLTEEALWFELVACLLGSRVRHDVSTAALTRLRVDGLLRPPYSSEDLSALKDQFFSSLSRQDVSANYPASIGNYPFARQRAQYLVATISNIYFGFGGLRSLLSGTLDVTQLRKDLIERCTGIGPKQASLYLTNVGVTSDLAIIDVHVLRYLTVLGFTQGGENPSLLRDYLVLEERLRDYASSLSCTLASLDTAIWIVMRSM